MVRHVGSYSDVVNITLKKIKSFEKEIQKDKEVTVDQRPKEVRKKILKILMIEELEDKEEKANTKKKILRMMMKENEVEEEEKEKEKEEEEEEKTDLKKEKIEESKSNMKNPTVVVMSKRTMKLMKILKKGISEKNDQKMRLISLIIY